MAEDNIRVISQSTQERLNETINLWLKVKPLLDKGHIYSYAVRIVAGRYDDGFNRFQDAWYRDLVEYGESQGYKYEDYSGKSNSIRYKK